MKRGRKFLSCTALIFSLLVPSAANVDSYSSSVLLPDVRMTLATLMSQPFEFFDLTLPATAAGLLDIQNPARTPEVRRWLYNHIVASGTDSTENGGESAQTMIYVGLEDGRFIGYYGPEGDRAYTFRPGSGLPADPNTCPGCPGDIWTPYGSLDAVNECMASGICANMSAGKVVASSCPPAPREIFGSCTSGACLDGAGRSHPSTTGEATCMALGSTHTWTTGTCCTATCCDRDIRAYYSTTKAVVGSPVAFGGWKAYDHRARLWYREAKAAWEDSGTSVSWSSIYEFSTNAAIGITVMGSATRNNTFFGVYAIDFELGGLSEQLNTPAIRAAAEERSTAWAYIVERRNGKLLGATSLDQLYNNSFPGRFTEQRLSAASSRHPSIAASAVLLEAEGWPETYMSQDVAGSRWELQSQVYTGPKQQLDWMIVVGQDIECATGQIWVSLAGRCETCRAGTAPSHTENICVDCSPGYAGTAGECTRCQDGQRPTRDRSACVVCPHGMAGTGGSCQPCAGFFSKSSSQYDRCRFWGSQAAFLLVTLAVLGVIALLVQRYSRHQKLKQYYLKRYRPDPGPAIHRSRTAETLFATDMKNNKERICIKKMANLQQFQAEITGRFGGGTCLDKNAVIEVLRWHTPKGFSVPINVSSLGEVRQGQKESTAVDDQYPFVLIMRNGERSLHDACAKERIAGTNLDVIQSAARHVAECLQVLHRREVCHGDIKSRNVLRVGSGWILCDLDAATPFGEPINGKHSTAYCPPEMACWRFAGGLPVAAHPSYDVWSFGVVLFELCSGQTLFSQDISNDELINAAEQTKLCTWHCAQDPELLGLQRKSSLKLQRKSSWRSKGAYHNRVISDEELEPVLSELLANETRGSKEYLSIVQDARNLIRWCLMGPISKRPSINEILEHRFLSHKAAKPKRRQERWHAFISHAQGDASGTANTLFFSYRSLGLTNWLDMRQQDLTLQGMRQGVANSDVFLMILSERLLLSWYCQQELLCAIEHQKPIQIVLETESRFRPFNLTVWNASKGSGNRQIAVTNQQGEIEHRCVRVSKDDKHPWQTHQDEAKLAALLCKAIDDNLPNAVAYRRRDFENDAMMHELCRRNGIMLPKGRCTVETNGEQPLEHTRQGVASAQYIASPSIASLAKLDKTISRQELHSEIGSTDTTTRVYVIYCKETGGRMFSDIQTGFEEATTPGRVTLSTNDADSIECADRVLLLLCDSVLTNEESANQLDMALRTKGGKLLSIVYDEERWQFGCPAQQQASCAVKTCLETHEALTYRPREPGGWLRHEHPAMIRKLLLLLGVLCLSADGDNNEESAATNDAFPSTTPPPHRSRTPPPRGPQLSEDVPPPAHTTLTPTGEAQC